MTWLTILVALLFSLAGGLCVLGVVAQLPGTWVLLVLALGVEWSDRVWRSAEDPTTFDTRLLVACFVLALLGEVLEFVAGAIGLRKGGGSRRGMWGSLIGGLGGLFVFTPLFAFVPFLGTFFGVLLGTFVGALLGEISHLARTAPRTPGAGRAWAALRPALWASLGRIAGTTGKVAVAVGMWLTLSVSAFWA